VDITGADLNNQFTQKSGTSLSAGITAGSIALIMEWAVVRGNYTTISAADIKNLLIRGAKKDPNRLYPNRDWGDGVIIMIILTNNKGLN